ncbi:MAG: carbonic anhydrase [Gemmatimonadota bacterium]
MPEHLIEGLRRFRTETFPRYREHYQKLVEEGQKPSTLFIGCSDSRVVPDLLTSTGPGELFIVRNVGALVPPSAPDGAYHGTAAGIEYAVLALNVTDIVVCGHSHCGAMQSLYAPPNPEAPHLARWLELGHPARVEEWTRAANAADEAPVPERSDLLRTEQRAVALQLERLMTYPSVAKRVEAGTLALHGWHYIMEEGRVLALDVERQEFVPIP